MPTFELYPQLSLDMVQLYELCNCYKGEEQKSQSLLVCSADWTREFEQKKWFSRDLVVSEARKVIWSRGPAMCLELFWNNYWLATHVRACFTKGFGLSLAKCVCSATHPQSHGSMRWRRVCQKGQAWWQVLLWRVPGQVPVARVPESTSTWFQVLLRYLFKWSIPVPRAQVCHCGMCPALNHDIAVVWPLLLQGLRGEANESTTRSIRRGVNATRAHCRSPPTCPSRLNRVSEILNASCRLGSRVSKAQR